MNCICCLSKKLSKKPLGLTNHFLCRSCGFIFQINHNIDVDPKRIVDHYQKIDPHFAVARSKQAFFESAIGRLSNKIRKNGRSILDIGCGYGYFLELAQKAGWKAEGVEITKQVAAMAKRKIGEKCIFTGKLKQAKYPKKSFHAITLWDVLVMVENPVEEVKECYRLLKPGGIIGIRVRNVLFQRFAYYAYKPFKKIGEIFGFKYPSVFHPYCYSSRSIELLLRRLGFTKIQIINSPLTTGDPYKHAESTNIINMAKLCIRFLSKLIYGLSFKKWIVGPSILVWAEKA